MNRGMDAETSGNVEEFGTIYSGDYTDTNPKELPSLIVDYANMIRNDIILLDNSFETRTRKRGNLKVEKYNTPLDLPCSCELQSKEIIDLGEEYFPRFIETKNCSKILCPSYNCQKSFYDVTILKKTGNPKEVSQVEVPYEFKHRWVAFKFPVAIGCVCTRDYIDS
ncbi:prothoracicotropic hormone [Battus philenor]|uniref:prothoracicotropic hormone n=1 Tax=Battus philenor TaxID=42288 RepID=UPI0035CFF940